MNAYPAASGSDRESFDQTLADFIEEENEEAPDNASPQKIRNVIAMLAISTPNVKGKLTKYSLLFK